MSSADLEAENADLRETIKSWFEIKSLAKAQLEPQFVNAVRGYLRTSRSGGMPQKQSDQVEAVLEDFARLYLADFVWPILLRIAEDNATALVVPEAVKPLPGISDERMLEAITSCLNGLPQMPVTVAEMNDYDRKFFDIIAKQSGMLLFFQHTLIERLRVA